MIMSETHSRQVFIKKDVLLKRESNNNRHFSFGEYFVERIFGAYISDLQLYVYIIHQFNSFTDIIKSVANYTMNIQEAKAIRLADYLQSIGYSPVR